MSQKRIGPDHENYENMLKMGLAEFLGLKQWFRETQEALSLFAERGEFYSSTKSATQSALAYFRQCQPSDKSLHPLHKAFPKWIKAWQQLIECRWQRMSTMVFRRAAILTDFAVVASTEERLARAILGLGEARAQQLFGERLTAAPAQAFELPWGKQSLSSEELIAIAQTGIGEIDAQWESLRAKIAP